MCIFQCSIVQAPHSSFIKSNPGVFVDVRGPFLHEYLDLIFPQEKQFPVTLASSQTTHLSIPLFILCGTISVDIRTSTHCSPQAVFRIAGFIFFTFDSPLSAFTKENKTLCRIKCSSKVKCKTDMCEYFNSKTLLQQLSITVEAEY